MLAQLLPDGSVPTLARPPLLQWLLLEQPWPAAIGLVIAGGIAFVLLNRAARTRAGMNAAGGAFALAAGVLLLASLVTTENERLRDRTRQLVAAAAGVDTVSLEAQLGNRLTFWAGTRPSAMSRSEVLDRVSATLGGPWRVKSHSIGAVQAVVDGAALARTQVRVWVQTDAILYDAPVGSWWRIDWRRENDQPDGAWRVVGLTLMQLDGVPNLDTAREFVP